MTRYERLLFESPSFFEHIECIMPQILVQIQQTAVQSQRALSVTRQQVANKERERRILQLTVSEIGQIEHSVNVYKGVGKMC
jgi:prefoldin subunit 1